MASAAEQLAANLNFGAFAKAEALKKRIWFTLGALLIYRLGTYIPIPGINLAADEDNLVAAPLERDLVALHELLDVALSEVQVLGHLFD